MCQNQHQSISVDRKTSDTLEVSGWKTIHTSSSMCSGILTAEMGLGVASKIVNESGVFQNFRVDVKCVALWDLDLVKIQITNINYSRLMPCGLTVARQNTRYTCL